MNTLMINEPNEQTELLDFQEANEWRRAYAVWLSGKRPHTRRAYQRIVEDFLQFVNVEPSAVTGDMVNAWKLHLQSLGRKDTTIAQRLAGLSSFFRHLQRKAALLDRNPVDMCERGDLNDSPYGNARPLTKADFNAIWNELDPNTATGALYRALVLSFSLTGKRRSELLRLHGRDLAINGADVTYRVQTKGGKVQHRTLPAPAVHAIRVYLATAGRTWPVPDDEPLFMATHATGSYVTADGHYVQRAADEEVSGTAVSEAMKRAAVRAGVNSDRVTIHGMRHLAADIWQETHGKDMRGLQQFLGHANIATTQVYLDARGADETDYSGMADALFAGHAMAKT